MADAMRPGALERDASLVLAATYDRTIEASIDSIWENVLDWEHFPYVHAGIFESVELLTVGPWGFRANLGYAGGGVSELETAIDRAERHYVARTRTEAGTVGENWTVLDPIAADRTRVRVEFLVRPAEETEVERLGEILRKTYGVLWDQDEDMMQRRERALAAPPAEATPAPLALGGIAALRADLPRDVDFGGRRYRIAPAPDPSRVPAEAPEGLVVYALECPHRLAPLDACPVEGGIVTCPWHGYRFDVSTGRSADGRGLRLRPPPRLEVDESGRVWLTGGAERAASASM